MIADFFNIILHLDDYLQAIVSMYATWTYGILFLVLFFETGVIITPFLPGDSLLFAAGALAGAGALHVVVLFFTLTLAAIIGDTANYHIGKYLGPKVFAREESFFLRKQHLARAQQFYERYGKKTIILARFVPIIRTFAPFVAGIGAMAYSTFLLYNIVGAVLWSGLFIFAGYFFGNIQWVQEHFGALIVAIIAISFLPFVKELIVYVRVREHAKPHQ